MTADSGRLREVYAPAHTGKRGPSGTSYRVTNRSSERSSASPPRPEVSQSHPCVSKRSSESPSARRPCPQVLQSHLRVAKQSSIGPSARRPCPEVSQRHPRVANHPPTDLKTVSFRCHNRSSARRPCPEGPRVIPAPSLRHLRAIPVPSPHNPCAIPVLSPHHPRAIPASSPPGKSVFYRMLADSGPFSWTSRCSLGAPVGLRHGDPVHRHLRAISTWQSIFLTRLRHGDLTHRYFRGIPAWQSVLLSGIRHDKLVHRYPRGIILWRSQTGHLPLLIHEIGLFHGH